MPKLQRTYSSPDMKGRRAMQSYSRTSRYDNLDEDQQFFIIGDRVLVDGTRPGSVAFFGELDFTSGDWVGVVLDEPTGNHDGKIHGREYFHCAPRHGLFVRPSRLSRLPTSPTGYSARPTSPHLIPDSRYSSGRSTQDLYFYDEDYRRTPTLKSLEEKIRSIERRASSNNIGPHSGILKRPDATRTSDKLDSMYQQNTVFNFRPRREQLAKDDIKTHSDSFKNASANRVDLSSRPPQIGDRVLVKSEKGYIYGTLRYLGETHFAVGEWAGVDLDEPLGRNDGTVLGHQYFYCKNDHGLFVPATRIRLEPDGSSRKYSFNTMRSTIWSPPPTTQTGRSSLTPSYSYDSYQSGSSSYSGSPNLSYYNAAPISSFRPLSSTSSQSVSPSTLRSDSNLLTSSRSTSSNRDFAATSSPNLRDNSGSKFKESDLDAQIRKYMEKPKDSWFNQGTDNKSVSFESRPKSVIYTFKSSKYDGNPVAVRNVRY